MINHKRVYRLYREEGLKIRTKRRKKRYAPPRMPLAIPATVNQRRWLDFVSDQFANGRRFRTFNVVDDFYRGCLNEYWFKDLREARLKIEQWRVKYNTERPHISPGNLTHEEYVRAHNTG